VQTGADGERGRATQRDVTEATAWLIAEGIADPERIAVMGHSFGAYSTLLGLAQTPDTYACGVALAPMAAWSYRWVVWALPKALKHRVPYTQLDAIDDPLLLVHGNKDRVLPVQESRHVASVLSRRGSSVAYVEVVDGHDLQGEGIPRAIAEAVDGFLAGCLDGTRGPLDPTTWPESARIVTGEEQLRSTSP
jgi:dipeptidyl aminopeptidase/acylaminoacyl peptidase